MSKGKDSLWRPENLTEEFLAKLGHRRQVDWSSSHKRISREIQFEEPSKSMEMGFIKNERYFSFAICICLLLLQFIQSVYYLLLITTKCYTYYCLHTTTRCTCNAKNPKQACLL